MEKESKRSGTTVVTSVSVSKEFNNLLSEYNMSPTECFRRGVAVTLCDLGVGMYQSPKNEERLKYVKEFLAKIDEDHKTRELFDKVVLFEQLKDKLTDIQNLLNELNNKGVNNGGTKHSN